MEIAGQILVGCDKGAVFPEEKPWAPRLIMGIRPIGSDRKPGDLLDDIPDHSIPAWQ